MGKYGPEKTPYLVTFHAVRVTALLNQHGSSFNDIFFLRTLNFVHFGNVAKIRKKYSVPF